MKGTDFEKLYVSTPAADPFFILWRVIDFCVIEGFRDWEFIQDPVNYPVLVSHLFDLALERLTIWASGQ